MEKCKKCLITAKKMGHKTPKGYKPFSWGPTKENPQHFYVFPENTPNPLPGFVQELDVISICKVSHSQRR